MDEARIQALVNELDSLAPREGAVVRFSEGYKYTHEDENERDALDVEGNAAGYLQLGLVFLRAAFEPAVGAPSLDGDVIYSDARHVIDDESAFLFGELRRWENPPAHPREAESGWSALTILVFIVAYALLALFLVVVSIGLYQFVKSLFPFTRWIR